MSKIKKTVVLIIEKQTIDLKKQMLKNAALFSDLSGIGTCFVDVHSVKRPFQVKKPCSFCRSCKHSVLSKMNCYTLLTDAAQALSEGEGGMLFFCPSALCHIIIPVFTEHQLSGLLLTEPLLCAEPGEEALAFLRQRLTPPDTAEPPALHTGSLLILRPGKAAKALRLLTRVTAPDSIPSAAELLQEKLRLSIADGNPQEAQNILSSSIEIFLSETGDDFKKLKADCIQFLFMLHELAGDNSITPGRLAWPVLRSGRLTDAVTVGDLKSCTDEVGNEFMSAVFQSVSLKHNALMKTALELIHREYRSKLTQNSVASSVFLSPSYFSKIFKETTGCSFNQYLNLVRIQRAKELLSNPAIDAEHVFSMVGYEDRSYFGKVFRELTKTTPKRYRDSLFT